MSSYLFEIVMLSLSLVGLWALMVVTCDMLLARARASRAEAAIERVREVVESEKHWNEKCGWDVPAIRVLAAIEAEKEK